MKQNTEIDLGHFDQELAKVHQVLMEQLEITKEQIVPEARIIDDLGADSLDVVEIIMKLEDKFEITIPDEEAEKGTTVERLCEVVATLLEQKRPEERNK